MRHGHATFRKKIAAIRKAGNPEAYQRAEPALHGAKSELRIF
jgi:hypothetical protein